MREYRLTGTFRGPSAQVASVLHYQNGGYSIVRPDGESHHNKPLFGRPRTVTEVALGVHSSSFSMLLPAAGGVDFFSVEADVQWQVVDPYIVVRARLTDIDLILAPELQDRLRAVSDRFSLDQAKDAWEAMRRALNENATPLGVHLGVQTRAYVRVDLDQAHIHRQAHRYEELLEKGDTRGLAFMMARSPADASAIFALIKEAEREAADRSMEMMRLLLDRGLLSRDDINDDARTILNLLRTTPPTSASIPPALPPAPGAKPPCLTHARTPTAPHPSDQTAHRETFPPGKRPPAPRLITLRDRSSARSACGARRPSESTDPVTGLPRRPTRLGTKGRNSRQPRPGRGAVPSACEGLHPHTRPLSPRRPGGPARAGTLDKRSRKNSRSRAAVHPPRPPLPDRAWPGSPPHPGHRGRTEGTARAHIQIGPPVTSKL